MGWLASLPESHRDVLHRVELEFAGFTTANERAQEGILRARAETYKGLVEETFGATVAAKLFLKAAIPPTPIPTPDTGSSEQPQRRLRRSTEVKRSKTRGMHNSQRTGLPLVDLVPNDLTQPSKWRKGAPRYGSPSKERLRKRGGGDLLMLSLHAVPQYHPMLCCEIDANLVFAFAREKLKWHT